MMEATLGRLNVPESFTLLLYYLFVSCLFHIVFLLCLHPIYFPEAMIGFTM
jgi:hypothetical protein